MRVGVALAVLLLFFAPAEAGITVGNTSTAVGFVVTTLTWSHDSNGDILWVAAMGTSQTATLTATYNGVAMTGVVTKIGGNAATTTLFYLLAPASGSHNVVVTSDTNVTDLLGVAVSYSGAQQSGVPEATGTSGVDVATTETTTITTTHDNAWVVLAGVGEVSVSTLTASTNATARGTQASGVNAALLFMDSNGTISAQAYAMTFTSNNLELMEGAGASFLAAPASGPRHRTNIY